MDRRFHKETVAEGAGVSPPSEAWLFAQQLLGNPVSSPVGVMAKSRADREHLEWLAKISPEYERRLRREQSAEAEARAKRELLDWVASISDVREAQ
jgi:hypothetical protein